MDSSSLDYLTRLAQKAAEPKVLRIPNAPAHVYGIVQPDGTVDMHEVEPPPREHTALDLSAIAEFALDFTQEEVRDEDGLHQPANRVEVWYSREGVVCYLDANTRRDLIRLPLVMSKQISLLLRMESEQTQPQKQAEFVRTLRIDLAGCVPETITKAVRHLKFRVNAGGESEVQHSKVSVGRQLMAELTGSDAIPEEVTVTLPIWKGFLAEKVYRIRCALVIDPHAESFTLIAFPGEIEKAIREAEKLLGELIAQAIAEMGLADGNEAMLDRIPILYGKP